MAYRRLASGCIPVALFAMTATASAAEPAKGSVMVVRPNLSLPNAITAMPRAGLSSGTARTSFLRPTPRPCGSPGDIVFIGAGMAALVGILLIPVGIATKEPVVAISGGAAALIGWGTIGSMMLRPPS